ncbi:MAG: Hsp70 family protein, partial [Rhodospirillaceae bacterium]|nr:Hsp70 family protein [Rhodospirillales bacterium]
GIPPMTAGAARIRVTFQVDADGLLTVGATELTTGVEQHVAVKPSYGLNEDEMANMLRASLENARDDMAQRLLAESVVEAKRSVLAVRSALGVDADLLSESERQGIDAAMKRVDQACAGKDRDDVNAAVEQLELATKSFAEKRMDRGIRQALAGVSVERLDDALGGDE